MLDAACAGEVFTSPVPDQMLEATKVVDGGAGVLHIVKNYTGDVMNFEMAAELAAAEPASTVESVVTDDDVAVQDSHVHRRPPRRRRHRAAGEDRRRRGRAGPQPRRGRRRRPPGQRQRAQHGRGADLLHGAGRRQADLRPARRPRWRSASASTASRGGSGCRWRRRARGRRADARPDPDRPRLHRRRRRDRLRQRHGRHPTDRAVRDVSTRSPRILDKAGVRIARSLVGPYITSLDMAGCSVTLLRADDELLRLWDARSHAGAAVGMLMADESTVAPLDGLDPRVRPRDRRERAVPHRSRRGHRRRRPRHQHGPRHDGGLGALDEAPPADMAALC